MEDLYDHPDPSLIYVPESIPGIDCPDSFDEEFLEGCNCRIEFSLILTYHKEYFRHRGILARICCTSFLHSMASKCYFKKAKSNSLPDVRYSHLA